MKKELHLVLSVDTMSEQLMQTITEVVIVHARDIHATALLAHGALNEGTTKPDIHLYSDDFLMGKEDIEAKAPAASPTPVADALPAKVLAVAPSPQEDAVSTIIKSDDRYGEVEES